MKQKLLNKLWLRVGMIVAIMTTALAGTVKAEKITSHTNIVSGTKYYIGATVSGTDYYFYADGSSVGTGVQGTSKTNKSEASVLVFEGSGTSWSIKFDGTSNYLSLASSKANGKVNVVSSAANWTAGTASDLITLTINGYKLQKNSGTSLNFGSYASGQTNVWLEEASGSSQMESVLAPSFSPAGGTYTSTQTVSISCETSGATIYYTTDGSNPTTSSNVYSTALTISENTTVKAMAVKDGMNNSAVATATYTINLPYSGPDYVRVNSVDYLTDGAKVIIAARYNSTATSYYAMTAAATGKPTGVNFTSTTSSNGEILPTSIVDNESTYCWTVGVTENGYTFTNESNHALGYSSSTNFAQDGDNTAWVIARSTAGSTAMVSGYEGFYITNKNNTGRGIALNNSHNYGPYSTGNNNSTDYNFYVDIFVQGVTPASDPAITADNVGITYDATSGTITYNVSNSVSDGVVSAEITGGNVNNWLTLGTVGATVPFTCTANSTATERTAQVTLTYTYNTSETKTAVVTVTQAADPNAVMTITEVRTQGTGSVQTKGIVTSCVGTTAYIQDANAAICVYGESLTVGDEIRVSGTLTTFNGLLEIGNPTVVVLSSGNTVTPEVLTIAQVKASTKQGWLVKIENATVTEVGSSNNYTIAQGEETITLHGALGEVAVNDVITFTGNIGYYNSVQLVNPTDVTVTGTVTPTTYTLSWTAGEHTELFVFDAANETTPLTSGDEIAAGTTILVSVDVESGYELESLEVDGEDVTSQIDESGAYTFTMPTHAVTVTATAVAVTPPTPASGKYVKVTSTDDLTDGQYLIVYEDGSVAFDGSLETLDATGNTIEVTINNNEIAATSTTTAAEFTIDVTAGTIKSASGKYIFASTYNNELKTSTSVPENTNTFSFNSGDAVISVAVTETQSVTLRYNSASNQTRFRYYKSGQQAIQLYKKVESVTVTSAGYATYASDNALDFTGSSIKAYIASADGTTGVTFTKIDKVPAGTGVLLYKDGGATENIPVFDGTGAEDTSDNVFVPGTGAAVASEGTGVKNYILSNGNKGVGFYPAFGKIVAVGKAYISVSTETNVKGFIMLPGLDDDATGLERVQDVQEVQGAIYNLAGQRISKMQKGINIVNGKKVLK